MMFNNSDYVAFLVVIVFLVLVTIIAVYDVHTDYRRCEQSGGVPYRSLCFKKDIIIDIKRG